MVLDKFFLTFDQIQVQLYMLEYVFVMEFLLIQIQNFKLELLQSVYNCTWIWSKV